MLYDISVLIATYNRSLDLKRTLEGMVKAQKGDLSIEFVVVDNGSTDQTKLIVDSFSDRMPIQYIFEPRSGKNRALNTALEKCRLGKIVVFTDDDVDVSPDWLVSIHSACERWPDHSVFGGRINVVFPVEQVPKWAFDADIREIAFAYHNYSDRECTYNDGSHPFGPNFWVRRKVFEDGRRFNEAVGPHPTNRIMGSETSFLFALLKDGYEIVYSPTVVVGHRIQPETLRSYEICKRFYRCGRAAPYLYGLPRQALLKSHPAAWRLYRCGAIMWNSFKVVLAASFSSKEARLVNCAPRIRKLGLQIESMRLAKQYREDRRL
jgi:glycosyltransferase involved in cell wall biosynthesis